MCFNRILYKWKRQNESWEFSLTQNWFPPFYLHCLLWVIYESGIKPTKTGFWETGALMAHGSKLGTSIIFFIQFHNFIEFGIHYTKYLVATYLLVISKESYNCCSNHQQSGMMLLTLTCRESLGSASIIIMTEIYIHKKCLTLPLHYLRISYSLSLSITYVSSIFAF